MKTACIALLFSQAAAFAPAPKVAKSSQLGMAPRTAGSEKSVALPWSEKPANLDGSLVGDVGFDPFGYTDFPQQTFLVGGKSIPNILWYREAEIAHGRVAMLAALGYVFPNIVHFPGSESFGGVDAFANMNPLEAVKTVPSFGWVQIAIAIGFIEKFHIEKLLSGSAGTGDIGLGQKSSWNPFNFSYSEAEYAEKQLQELKNGRLAMVAIAAFVLQNAASKVGIVQQLGEAFTIPEFGATAGSGLDKYFIPGI